MPYFTRLVKEQFTKKGLLVSYLLLVLVIGLLAYSVFETSLFDYQIPLAVIDEDQSETSFAYLDALNHNDLFRVTSINQEEALKSIRLGTLDALLIIPKGYFDDMKNQTLRLIHSANNPTAPAFIDLLAADLMPLVAKERLVLATQRYAKNESPEDALKRYMALETTEDFHLETLVTTSHTQRLIGDDATLKTMSSGRVLWGYGLLIVLLVVTLPFAMSQWYDQAHLTRLKTIPYGLLYYTLSKRVYHGLLMALFSGFITWLLSIQMPISPMAKGLLALSFWCVGTGYFEICSWLYRFARGNHNMHLFAISCLMIPAWLGGALFPIDILSNDIHMLSSLSPFYHHMRVYDFLATGSEIKTLFAEMTWMGVFALALGVLGFLSDFLTLRQP